MKVGIIGLGTIGIKMVEYLSDKGFQIVAYNWRSIEEKKSKFSSNLDKKIKYEKIGMNQMDLIKSRIHFTEILTDLSEVDLIIDSSIESYEVKVRIYKQLKEENISKVIACTTSSLNLETLGNSYDSSLFVGVHFFNPPTKMRLVEISFLKENKEPTKAIVYEFLGMLDDKKIIELPLMQGYIVNRLLFLYMNAAFRIMQEYDLSPEVIDEAMKAGTNMPMGPCELNDYVGTDITLSILNELKCAFGADLYEPCPILNNMVASGKLGRKSKYGFYNYI
ncbi:3-hydroxyacyl-CoA dehydrogenase family protein [Methanomethylovorans sp.]|uniref:3-hydroxyacyl-CoA dehydrogenase family protein n=1 Tax=Methanomethylovorans sp. TaxID=2758717 RepID=UPI003D0E4B07